jgi:hypothetical protein
MTILLAIEPDRGSSGDQMRSHNANEFMGRDDLALLPELRKMSAISCDQVVSKVGVNALNSGLRLFPVLAVLLSRLKACWALRRLPAYGLNSKNHAMVVMGDLQVSNMSRSAAGSIEHPGRNVQLKTGLNRAILDQGWAEFRRQLKYKMIWSGGQFGSVIRDPTNTTHPAAS